MRRALLLLLMASALPTPRCQRARGPLLASERARHGGAGATRALIRHGRSRAHLTRARHRPLVGVEDDLLDKPAEPLAAAVKTNSRADEEDAGESLQKYFGTFDRIGTDSPETSLRPPTPHPNHNETGKSILEELPEETYSPYTRSAEDALDVDATPLSKAYGHVDVVTRFLRMIETQHLLGENCTAGTDLNLGEGVVDRYAQERFRVEADVAVNRANMLTRLWKYAGASVMNSEYLLHASVFSMVEFDDDIFAAGNCYDQYQYKDYQLFCPFAYRLPEGPILVKDLAVEYKYLSNTSEWFYIARKNAERVIRNHNQFSRGFNTYTFNDTAHTDRVPDEILSVTYEDGKWSKPYYDCGGGNIWMLTYTVPFFGYANGTYFFKGTSGIDIDLRRVDIDQCPLKADSTQLNIFAATDKCKKSTTEEITDILLIGVKLPYICVRNAMDCRGLDFSADDAEMSVISKIFWLLVLIFISFWLAQILGPFYIIILPFTVCCGFLTCVSVPGLGFRRGSYLCVCRRGFYFPNTTAEHRYYNGTIVEEQYERLMLDEDSVYALPHAFECVPCAEGCEQCNDGSPCVAALNWAARTAILVLACLVISCLPLIVLFTIKYGHVKVVRAASPALLRVIALGALLIYCTTLVMYGRPTVVTCTVRVWLREVGFCLTYGALMLKTWRISMIFQVRSAKAVKITDMNLLRRVGIIVGVACVLLAIRTLVAPPAVIVGRTKDDLKAYLCKTDWWDHSFTTLEVIFLMWGIRLCIMVRKAPSEFNESRFISMAIYNEFLLSVFLNVSMLFLQSPANPDLLYIIFFCHTQLTVTLLLCFIFGSKAYMVYKGHGKDEAKSQGKFKSKSRAAESTYTMTTNARSHHFCDNMSDRELEEEFRKLYNQLEKLRERGGGSLARRIAAMQDAASQYDHNRPKTQPAPAQQGLKLNTVLSAVADKLMCSAVTPAEESSSSGKDGPSFEAPPAYKHKTYSITFTPTHKPSDESHTDETSVSPKRKADSVTIDEGNETERGVFKISGESNCGDANGVTGVFKISGEANCADANVNGVFKVSGENSEAEKPSEIRVSPSSSAETSRGVRSGHARTHAIVINLDDKSRFTEEVTV